MVWLGNDTKLTVCFLSCHIVEYQGTPCSKQAQCLKCKWLQQYF